MGEGRAVEGRQASPPVCLATPFHSSLPGALFCTRHSLALTPEGPLATRYCSPFLPGARNPQFGSRRFSHGGQCRAQISIAKPLSNRELELLEPRPTHRKQMIGPRSNRELSTNPCFCNSDLRRPFTSHSLALLALTQEGPQEESVLPGFASRVEIAVTYSKQTVATFLPGSRIGTLAPHFSHAKTHSAAPALAVRKTHRQFIAFLTETGSHSEIAVTRSKQTTATFLTGARIDILALHSSQAETRFVAPTPPRSLNLVPRPRPRIRNRHFTAATAFRYSAWTMLDLGYVREHLDAIEKMARDRGITLDLAPFREIDTERRQLITSAERLKAERNRANEEIAGKKRSGEDATSILALMKEVSDRLKRDDARIAELDERLKQFLLTVPNIPHASVPVGKSAADNVEVRRWGAPPKFDFKPRPHWEIGEGAGILDFQAAVKIAGARFAVYKGLGARLERALANFFLDLHTREHGYTEILPPFLVNTASLTGVGQLPKFAADMFHVEGTDLWLTPTSEVELTSLHRDETLDADKLPEKVCAWTACFRSEAGAAGKDTRGIKRQHQFQKVELFKFTRPEQSYDELESLVKNVEVVLQRLGLHYRVMLLCTADMGFASAKTYDIEVWLPAAGEFMEISSCSNTEAFQARRSGIRCKQKAGKSEFVHTLNGSGLAVGRTWIAIAENFQQADGSILIPEALKPYMGVDRIPPAGNI
jgi:seryl-tRNA synthetase